MVENMFTIEIAMLIAFAACYFIYQALFKRSNMPDLVIAGAKKGDWFPYLQAKLRNTTDGQKAIFSAYKEWPEKPYALPCFGSPAGMVVLPKSWIKNIISQPDHVLNLWDIGVEMLQLDYAFLDKRFNSPPLHINLIAKTLTKNYGNLIPDMVEEANLAFTEQWGRSDEWTSVKVYDTVQNMLGLITSRVTYGLPLSRDPELRKVTMEFVQRSFVTGLMLYNVWKPIRPLVALLATLPHRLSLYKFRRLIVPEVKKRLADSNRGEKKDQQNDFINWAIQQAEEFEDPYFSKPEVLASRALFANYVSIHTSAFSLTHAVLDLATAGPEVQEEMRQEVVSVLASCNGEWSKKALAKMYKIDSLLRESARLNTFMSVAGNRYITAPEGLALPNGQTLPKGTPIMFPAAPVMLDETYYPNPLEFQPLRFVPKANNEGDADDDMGTQDERRARTAFSCTSAEYMAFGHGKHACPGRFFAAAELKLMLAHLLLEYELEKIDERPVGTWYGIMRIPPISYQLKVRRRSQV